MTPVFPTTSAGAATSVEDGLRTVWQREKNLCNARGAAWTLACLSGLLALDLVLDWTLDLPWYARLILLVVNLAVLAQVVYRQWWRLLRPYSPVELALRVERVTGSPSGLFVSCVQLRPEAAAAHGFSPDLMEAVRFQAARQAAGIDFSRLVDTSGVRKVLKVAVPVLLVIMAAAIWQPGYFLALGCRMLNPWTSAGYPTLTKIASCSGDLTVLRTEPIPLQASAAGRIPDAGSLHLRFKGAGWETVQVRRQGAGNFTHVLQRTNDDFDYYFSIGDAHSQRFHVAVVQPPRITKARVELSYPEYTRLAAQEVATMNLSLPEGTTALWNLQLDRPVLGAEIVMEDQPPKPCQVGPDGKTVSLKMAPDASSSYVFRFRWKTAGREHTEEGARYYVQIVPDADPQAGLVRPFEDGKATAGKVVDLAFWAKDDYALGDAAIVYSLNDGEEKRHELGSLEGKKSIDRQLTWPVAKVLTNLKEGDILTFAVEVKDVRSGAGHAARSRSRRLQFVSPDDYLAYTLARQRKYLSQLRPLYLQEVDAGAHLRALHSPAAISQPAPAKEHQP